LRLLAGEYVVGFPGHGKALAEAAKARTIVNVEKSILTVDRGAESWMETRNSKRALVRNV
jgi:hypothetical protein